MHCTLRTLPPSPPHSNTHCHESSENFLYKIYQVLGILPILINNRSDTVVQWISAGLVWSRTWVQSYKKLDFFSVIGNRISNTSYHFQYFYYPGGNETGAKPNLITCITEIFLSASTLASMLASFRHPPPPLMAFILPLFKSELTVEKTCTWEARDCNRNSWPACLLLGMEGQLTQTKNVAWSILIVRGIYMCDKNLDFSRCAVFCNM